MKKLLALTLVLMLVLTSVFTGVTVFAEDAVVEDTTVEQRTVWEDEFGIKVDESIFPGYCLGSNYQIWDPDNPSNASEKTPNSARSPETGVKYYTQNSDGTTSIYRDTTNHRKYAPSIAIDAGRTGLAGDNALVFGMPVSTVRALLMFNNRNTSKVVVCNSGTWKISFDIKLVSGEVEKIYSNFQLWAPNGTDGTCVNDRSIAYNNKCDESTGAYGTDGYNGSDISKDKWTNLSFETNVSKDCNSFFINIVAPGENGAIVLIDNIQILNSKGVNYFNSDNICPTSYSNPTESVYYDEYEAGTLYINKYFGNFNDEGFSAYTDWEQYNLTVDESIVPGYYLKAKPWCFGEDSTETSIPDNDGTPYLTTSGYWYTDAVTRRRWVPVVALGAGKTGKADDNALVFGMPTASAQTPLVFDVRNNNSGAIVYNKNNKYRISFDIKSVTGTCKGIYATTIIDRPTTSVDSKYTCLPEKSNGDIIQTIYNNKYDTETGTYGTDGYSQADVSTTEWKNLSFTVTPTADCNWFYINIIPADDKGAVVLIDNIIIQNINGENLFNADNVRFTSAESEYKDAYEPIQYYLGTFDSADPVAVENVVDIEANYVPHPEIFTTSATVAPTVSAAGEGIKGSYAMSIGVSASTLANKIQIKGFNQNSTSTWYPLRTYLVEFKLRLKSGTADSFKVSMATDGVTIDPANGLLHDYDAFYNGETWYRSTNQTYMNISGADITGEWQQYRVYITTNGYDKKYRTLQFDLVGKSADTVILMDDLQAIDITDPEEETPIWVMSNMDPAGSFMDLTIQSKYEIVSFNETDNIIKVSNAGIKVGSFIADMQLARNFQWGYYNYQWLLEKMPTLDANGKIAPEVKNEYLRDNVAVSTDNVLVLVGRNGTYQDKIYVCFTVAVENDITSDGAVDARDIVRAKKISAGTLEATDAQLVAANATDGNGIQAEDVAALRGIFMN